MQIGIKNVTHALEIIERLSALMTPEQEFESLKAEGDCDYEDADEMVSEMSDERLCEEYSLFMEFIREAKEVMKRDT